MTFESEQTRIREIYDRLAQLGVNVKAVQEMNLPLNELETFCSAIYSLVEKRGDRHDMAN